MRRAAVLRRVCRVCLLTAVLCAALCGTVHAAQTAMLEVGLFPERLGHGTTVEFAFNIAATRGAVPSPLTWIELRYPKHFGLVTSGLGVASCSEQVLSELGPDGCPSRSLMGEGTATAEVPLADQVVLERANTKIFMAPLDGENIGVEFSVVGYSPIAADLIFPGLLLPAEPPYGGDLSIPVPLQESFSGGPDVSVVRVSSTIGPLGLTYYEHRHGKLLRYTPSGIVLPPRCPAGGFPFSITLQFVDGTSAISDTKVPCPNTNTRRRRRHVN